MKCDYCGKEDEFEALKLHARVGHGSIYDGDRFKLNLCGECVNEFVLLLKNVCNIDPIEDSELEVYG